MMYNILFLLLPFFLFFPSCPLALEAAEVLVIANKKNPHSIPLARYYMQQRSIPRENLLITDITDGEECDRAAYEEKIRSPLRIFLKNRKAERRIRCLLLMYGMPLRILPPLPSSETEKNAGKDEIAALFGSNSDDMEETVKNIIFGRKENADKGVLDRIKQEFYRQEQQNDEQASLDSELTLLFQDNYPLRGWIENPFYRGRKNRSPVPKENVIMVSRLDGPSPETVRRMTDDSITAETAGLKGRAYFDARWPHPGRKAVRGGYGLYDRSLHRSADLLEKQGRMPVIRNDAAALFQKGECPDAALYCGWYSLGKYVDAFRWKPGSVGYHIASSECSTLKKEGSQVWCRRMLEEGIAATIGPVGEPYVGAFPLPEIFFSFLTQGYLGLAESYFLSLPYLSWKMVLIGDPLYRPFRPLDTGDDQ